MAIELRKSIPDAELNSRIWGTHIDPNSYFRVLGDTGELGNAIYEDVLQTGAIRGTEQFGRDAYFAKGAPQGIYLHNQSRDALAEKLLHWPVEEVGNNNYFIEATKDFNPEKNPLYKPNSTIKVRKLPTIAGVPAPPELAFPISGTGSRWLSGLDANGQPAAPFGSYHTLAQADNTSFIDRINPANQRGLRMMQSYTPSFFHDKGYTGNAPEWKSLFDYTKKFSETSVPQHARNALHIGKTVMAQPETRALISGVKSNALPALAVAVTPFDANSRKELAMSEFIRNNDRLPTIDEELKLSVASGLEPALNFATFGTYDYFADTPAYKDTMLRAAQERDRRKEKQKGIDYPIINGQRFERTTK